MVIVLELYLQKTFVTELTKEANGSNVQVTKVADNMEKTL